MTGSKAGSGEVNTKEAIVKAALAWYKSDERFAGQTEDVLHDACDALGLSAFVQIRSAIPSGLGVILESADRPLMTQVGL